ncbi:MAG: biotin/lipoyl-containing protein [Desulfohalobiaceae bacterium]
MKTYKITIQGQTYEVQVQELDTGEQEQAQPSRPEARAKEPPRQEKKVSQPVQAPAAKQESAGAKGQITAPMPGMVLGVKVQEGQQVQEGEVLLMLEAMKMENSIKAEGSGQVQDIRVQEGDSVNTGDVLLVVS